MMTVNSHGGNFVKQQTNKPKTQLHFDLDSKVLLLIQITASKVMLLSTTSLPPGIFPLASYPLSLHPPIQVLD